MDATVAGKLRVKITGGTLEHKASGARVSIVEDVARVVGRGDACDLRLDDRLVSKAHCELAATERGVLVRDLASTNGTRVNDVVLGPNQYVLLRGAARIRVGQTDLEFTPDGGEERELTTGLGVFESRSAKMRIVSDRLRKLAMMSTTVLITGETGVGKTYFAEAIHRQSKRGEGPFVLIDCSALSLSVLEGELFGYEKGAFTGAVRAKKSPIVEAHGGTLFIDEIGDLPTEAQARLLRLIDQREVKAIGQNNYIKVDVRIIAATKHDLSAAVSAGRFRDDLYCRLATRIEIPPLRERPEDIEPLMQRMFVEAGKPELFKQIPTDQLSALKARQWTGNLRQLQQFVSLVVELSRLDDFEIGSAIDTASSLGASTAPEKEMALPEQAVFNLLTANGTRHDAVQEQANRIVFGRLYRETGGNISAIAQRAGITRNFARRLLIDLGIRKTSTDEGGET